MASSSSILSGKYPAKAHAKRVVEYIKSKKPDAAGVLYLEGQKTRMIEDNDEPVPFRQRRYFYYLSGCALPDCSLLYNMTTDHLFLFIPPINNDDVIWSGLPLSPEEALRLYDVDSVRTTAEFPTVLSMFGSSDPLLRDPTVFTIKEQVPPEHNSTLDLFSAKDFALLKPAIETCRIVKDDYEIALTRHANDVSAIAHTAALHAIKSATNEREIEALFLQKCIANGCREQAYHSIVAAGENAATLHYQKNTAPLEGKLNLLLDAGCEHHCYASDITRTFPISGKFSPESRAIYDIVLRMQTDCTAMLRAGVLWDDVHARAHRIAIKGLLATGILKHPDPTTDAAVEDIFAARTSVAFFPHGLGHYLGMDTHDTGGNPNYADADPMFRYLRVRGALPAGCIVTVEPGVYFCRFIVEPYLKDAKHARFIDEGVLERFWAVGGVRIEDNVLVTEGGCENLTTAVKGVEEMERAINGGAE